MPKIRLFYSFDAANNYSNIEKKSDKLSKILYDRSKIELFKVTTHLLNDNYANMKDNLIEGSDQNIRLSFG
jgi:hypothetical protein